MKKIKLAFLTGAFALSATMSFAQDANTIVQNHNKAIGGSAAWSKINSLKKEGSMSVQGMEMPCTLTIVKGKGMRQEFSVMGASNYVILTPTGGWTYLPVQGQTKAEPMPAEQLTNAADQMDFQDKVMEASEKKFAIVLDGKETIDSMNCFKLKVTDAEKDEHTYYIDGKTWYLVRTVEHVDGPQGKMDVVINYREHTKLPQGIVVAMKEDSGDSGVLKYSKIEANSTIDEAIFKP